MIARLPRTNSTTITISFSYWIISKISIINTYAESQKAFALNIAPIIGGIYTLIIGIGVIIAKNLKKDALAILCSIVGTLASISLGMIFGFIPIAFLSVFNQVVKN